MKPIPTADPIGHSIYHVNGRKCVSLRYENGRIFKTTYARWQLHKAYQLWDRELPANSYVVHKDGNPLNNEIGNLKVVASTSYGMGSAYNKENKKRRKAPKPAPMNYTDNQDRRELDWS